MTSTTNMTDFTILNKLGTGAFSEVYKVLRKSDRQMYALKKVRLAKLTAKEKDNALNEVRILASISHENIAGYKDAFFEQKTNELCIVMEYADGGDLQSKINQHKKTNRHLKEEDIWSIFYQMVNGLNALHKRKIVHRDIKCANVFLTKSGTVKLGDLNVSKVAKAAVMQTQTGTPYYASPEVWQDKPYDKSSDIWSLGAVLYEMVALSPPFTAKDMKGLYNRVIKGVYPKIPATFSSDLSSMISSLLKVDPKKRPSTEQILHMPVFIAKYNERAQRSGVFGEESKELMGTIKVPKNLSLLTERLPASQYEDAPSEAFSMAPPAKNKAAILGQHGLSPSLQAIVESQEHDEYIPMVRAKQNVSAKKSPLPPASQGGASRIVSAQKKGLMQKNARQMSGVAARRNGPTERVPSAAINANRYNSQTEEHVQLNVRADQSRAQNQQSELLHVQPYQKKYLQGVPGSSPVIRGEDLNYEQKYGKGPLIERAERLKRLQELKENMVQRNNERGESDDGAIRMIRDNRMKRIGVVESASKMRPPHGSMHNGSIDIIHKNKDVDMQVLYRDDDQRSNLPSIHGSQLQARGPPGAAYSPQYNLQPRQGGRFVKPPLAQIYAPNGGRNDSNRLRDVGNKLSRAHSKDYIHSQAPPSIRANRYGGGAGGVVEAGRQESQRLLMERYRRIDVNENPSADPRRNRSKILQSAAAQNYYSNEVGGSMPPEADYSRRPSAIDSSRQYIPMSQKGSRPVQYVRGSSRQLHPAMAMKLMNNQPSQAGGFRSNQASQQITGIGSHVPGGLASRPSWWG